MKHPDSIVPENVKGAKTDTISTESFSSVELAKKHYTVVRKRLLSVFKWHEYAGIASAEFSLTDGAGHEKADLVSEGDRFKINIPAPGTDSGSGFDWVQVEKVEEGHNEEDDWEYTLIKVRPTDNPGTSDNNTAHFFSDEANSYFMVKRIGLAVSAEVHGRNEQPNTDTDKIVDKIRNTIVAVGAILGVSKAQWKSLTNGIVKI
ncbi:hypothetical protein [Desertivirga arenae]|uniref:hypothetical protein n=1 Tax=Desertivirga arenae TaxID=2810309 RepID=UPI001A96D6A9|nr:hypothetical protein [Pedobacter sp. SYSU D00823]